MDVLLIRTIALPKVDKHLHTKVSLTHQIYSACIAKG